MNPRQADRIDAETTKRMKAMVDAQDAAVHRNRDLDYSILIAVIEQGLDDAVAFLDRIMEHEPK